MSTSILQACSLFAGFSESGLSLIAKIASKRHIPAGTPIFVENMVAESMFIISAGMVQLTIRSAKGEDTPLATLGQNESFGELSLLVVQGHRMVTAIAQTDCELIEISRRDFANLQKQKPQACLKLMLNIASLFGKRLAACRDSFKPLLLSQLGT